MDATAETKDKKDIAGDEPIEGEASTEELEDEEGDDEEIDEDLLDLAATFGVNPDDFDDASGLEKEIFRVAGQQQKTEGAGKPDTTAAAAPEALALEAYKLELNEENIDAALLAELQKFSKAQTEQFSKVLDDLRKKHHEEIGSLKTQLAGLAKVTDTQVRQADFRLVDKWIQKNEKAQAYYGEGDYEDHDEDSRPARRRRSLVSKAYRIRGNYVTQDKRPPSPKKLLDMAFAATPRKGKGKVGDTGAKKPTKAARATGAGTERRAAGKGTKSTLSDKDQLEEAGAKVTEWQRQHGISS